MTDRLHNIRVMVTRPVEQAEAMSVLIEQAGGQAVRFPALAIEPVQDAESVQRCKFASGYDWIIFISQNAVRHALSLLPVTNWPDNTAIAAIGQSTTSALRQAGLEVALQPEHDANSEGLLEAFSNESLAAKKMLIVRGVGGREALANGLRERQALVDYAEVYKRSSPLPDAGLLSEIVNNGIDIITVASGETLRNLASSIDNSELNDQQKQSLYGCPLVVVSERIRALAEQLGFLDTVIVADEPDNAGIIKAIEKWQVE